MNLHRIITSRASTSSALSVACAIAVAACGGGGGSGSGASQLASPMDPQASTGFTDTALVSNKVGVVTTSTNIDTNLQNPWGIAVAPGLPFWIADNNSNLVTLYSGTGEIETNEVTGSTDVGIAIPASAAGVQSNPTGQVYNGAGGFLISTTNGQEPVVGVNYSCRSRLSFLPFSDIIVGPP